MTEQKQEFLQMHVYTVYNDHVWGNIFVCYIFEKSRNEADCVRCNAIIAVVTVMFLNGAMWWTAGQSEKWDDQFISM